MTKEREIPSKSFATSPLQPTSKYAHVEPEVDSNDTRALMKCTLPPHREPCHFTSYGDYEIHYKQVHVNRCSECGKNFPSEQILNLHIEENHDPLMDEKRKRGEKTFGCFVEGCQKRCSTPQKRRLHLIDKHMFPRKYNFFIVNDGTDKHSSLLRPGTVALTQPRRISLSSPTCASPAKNSYEFPTRRRKHSLPSNDDFEPTSPPRPYKAPPKPISASAFSTGDTCSFGSSNAKEKGNTKMTRSPNSQDSHDTKDEIAELEKSMSALKFVPTSVTRQKHKRDGTRR